MSDITVVDQGGTADDGALDSDLLMVADATLTQSGPSRSLAQDAWRRFRRNKLALFGLALVSVLVLVAIVGPFLVQDPTKLSKFYLEGPTKQHPLGLDDRGGDVLARIVHGIRLSMVIGFVSAALQTVLGIVIGAIAGWYGRYVDAVLMRFVDIMLGIPYIILAYAFITFLGKGVFAVIMTLALSSWLQTSRTVRAGFIQAKNLEYVEAARALGVSNARIMMRHILPNVLQPVVVLLTIGIGSAILAEAALSFLGVGVQPPQQSLGLMINNSKAFFSDAPYLLLFPGLAIVLTVLGFILVGDGLRDALDVKDN
ncbi:MAG: ABC transporter permease [Microthrixaceae bacterium]|nr:ABC transporter permease [Microthrixaceae bacterium]MCO5313579.1 ABC transporter permease [Microthrixaceae bacterium]